MSKNTRVEHDSLGAVEVPFEAYYGPETARAVQNFPISGLRPLPEFIRATVLVKKAAVEAHVSLGLLDNRIGKAIVSAADEVLQGKLMDQFVLDVFQAGAGTSHNMNANEVLANRAIELLGGRRGDYKIVSPHDHVNIGQSTNDAYPTFIRVASMLLAKPMIEAVQSLRDSLGEKAKQFDHVVKSGRTHLQDASAIRLGQEFGAWASIVGDDLKTIERALDNVLELNLGGTAVGTGLNADPRYVQLAVENLSRYTGFKFRVARNFAALMQSMADLINLSGALRTLSLDLTKIANDIRLLSSGPTTGIGEIILPAVQPGSSIMPGKVNPSIAEMLNMVCFEVIGNDFTAMMAAQAGQLELNVMMPVIAHDLTQSLLILTNGINVFTNRLIKGIEANEERCKELFEKSAGIALALNPFIGYEKAAEVAKDALKRGVSLRQVVLEKGLLSEVQLEKILDPHAMTTPGVHGKGKGEGK
ncbi:MAG: aspartate ammonia-lyase [Candidatus Bathyarchaeia archaeon]|jgi:aspartate ammonia-lyase